MAITTMGDWQRGDSAADLGEYLRTFQAGGYEVHQVVPAVCQHCQHTVFEVAVDDTEGAAQRVCTGCKQEFPMLDSADYLDEAELEFAACPCGEEAFEVAVGFSFYDDGADIRWVSIGLRCVSDGVVGVYAEWKIGYGPSMQLLDQV